MQLRETLRAGKRRPRSRPSAFRPRPAGPARPTHLARALRAGGGRAARGPGRSLVPHPRTLRAGPSPRALQGPPRGLPAVPSLPGRDANLAPALSTDSLAGRGGSGRPAGPSVCAVVAWGRRWGQSPILSGYEGKLENTSATVFVGSAAIMPLTSSLPFSSQEHFLRCIIK